MANQFALNDDAAMAPAPRLHLAIIPPNLQQLPPFAGSELPVSRSPVGNEPRSRTPKAGELALSHGLAQVTIQLWPEGTIGAETVAGPSGTGNLRRNERGQDPRQWAKYLNQSQERENDKLRLELASAIRWIKLREQWWTQGVQKLQNEAGLEVLSLDHMRRQGELELMQRLAVMENLAAQADQLRAVEALKVQERETALRMLEQQASEMFKQGAALRQ